MKTPRILMIAAAALFAAGLAPAGAQTTAPLATAPVYVPDETHANDALPDGVFAWDALLKTSDATNGQDFARFTFCFTNVTKTMAAILSVHPSCGCTTVEMPAVPWVIQPGTNGEFKIKVDLHGKSGTLFKSVNIVTEKGRKDLALRINIAPPPPMPEMTDAQRAAGIAASKLDRQAVFKGECASCHLPAVEGRYGQALYESLCVVCHDGKHRNEMVPDLHNLQLPTNEEFWRTWVTLGKPGTLMPAFSTAQGGPLNDMQIASLAAYLHYVNPSRVPATTASATAK
jgi:mono/diheme cytochrome c family protein